MHDTEDKKWWVLEWRKKEDLFVSKVCPRLGLDAKINPEKKHNPFAPDLIVNGKLADLKCQQTPFFKAKVLYNIDAQFAVTFNVKDYKRYTKNYPEIQIYFWVDWKVLTKEIGGITYKVEPMHGVWATSIQDIKGLISKNQMSPHAYQRRTYDTQGNAKDSYIINLNELNCLHLNLGSY